MPGHLPVHGGGERKRRQRRRRCTQGVHQSGDTAGVSERRSLHAADRFGVGFLLGVDLNLFWHGGDRRRGVHLRASQFRATRPARGPGAAGRPRARSGPAPVPRSATLVLAGPADGRHRALSPSAQLQPPPHGKRQRTTFQDAVKTRKHENPRGNRAVAGDEQPRSNSTYKTRTEYVSVPVSAHSHAAPGTGLATLSSR